MLLNKEICNETNCTQMNKDTFSVSTSIFCGKLSVDHLRLLRQAGITQIELCCVRKRFDYYDKEYSKIILETISELGLQVTSMHAPFGETLDISSLDSSVRRSAINDIEECILLAEQLGSKVLVIHPGHKVANPDEREERIEKSKESIGKLLKILFNYKDIKLALETMGLSEWVGGNVKELVDIMDYHSDTRIGVCIDTNHVNLYEDLANATKYFQGRILNFHISDNDGLHERHWMPFQGVIDWKSFWEAITVTQYDGCFTYELINEENPDRILMELAKNFRKIQGID